MSATPFEFEQERTRARLSSNRIERDRIFRRVVLRAYDERCAITGLKLINGGGRAEVEAAHIRPVEKNGPDNINNGPRIVRHRALDVRPGADRPRRRSAHPDLHADQRPDGVHA